MFVAELPAEAGLIAIGQFLRVRKRSKWTSGGLTASEGFCCWKTVRFAEKCWPVAAVGKPLLPGRPPYPFRHECPRWLGHSDLWCTTRGGIGTAKLIRSSFNWTKNKLSDLPEESEDRESHWHIRAWRRVSRWPRFPSDASAALSVGPDRVAGWCH